MKANALVESLRNTAVELMNTASELETKYVVTPRSNPQEFKLVIPLGMFAGTAIDTLNLKSPPNVAYVGECRMGGVDYSSVRILVREPFDIDIAQWELVGDNTLVWSE